MPDEGVASVAGSSAADTAWLSDGQQQAWRQLIAMLIALPAALESDLQRSTGLTMFEYMVLANLSEAEDNALHMSELARRANSSLSRLSHVIGRMERKAWVRKRPSSDDRRVSEVRLTRSGMRTIVKAAPFHVAKVRELVIEPLSAAQLKHLADAASTISQRIGATS
jgi:DNA-binding MarR family transcriptional regulator